MSSYQASFLLANNRCSLLSAISYLVTMGSAAWFGPHRPKYPRPRMPVRPNGFLKIKQSTKKCTKCLKVYNSSKSTLLTLMQLFIVLTINRWRTVVSATWKYDDPRLNMSHEGAARVWHVQLRVVIFPFRTNYRVSYVLSSDQLLESWIICKLKSFSPLYLQDLILKTDDLYSVCLKRYAILVIKNSFKLTEE